MRKLLFFVLLAGLSNLASAGVVYYVDLVNTAASITSFEVALRGSDRFHSVLIGSTPLQGGGGVATVAIRKGEDGCLRDLRIGFADGRRIVHRDFNICKLSSYHAGQYLRAQNRNEQAATP